ncbi:MAG: 16S rRNA (uracil(1498)-N(3))-methyltransferase, partial [Chitinophagales bacterium]|nr:16S rRNA (uracil(1498)-N(3))-methyltransferase [Chitinophagales bacterium]
MHTFYVPATDDTPIIFLPATEMHHAIHVLRLAAGEKIQLIDGTGNLYVAEIIEAGKKTCGVKILSKQFISKQWHFHLHIAIAPTKSTDRFDFFVEKVTEMGIDEITPLLCQNSERKKINIEKEKLTLLAAVKQSGKTFLPKFSELITFEKFITDLRGHPVSKYIAYCSNEHKIELSEAYKSKQNALILIGPEGDFKKEEIELAIKNNFTPV